MSEANDLKRRRRGLFDETHKLMGEGRLRTALEKVFAFLDHHPNDEYALLVATVIAGRTRTSLISAKEPIPPEHLNDIRLDSIFAVCGNCEKSWISGDVFPWSANIGKLNPVGLQCSSCGVTLCRECLFTARLGTSGAPDCGIYDILCQNCGGKMSPSVKPTGRRPRQLTRQTGRVLDFIILRQGFIPPDPEYVQNLIKDVSPDVLETRDVRIHAQSWPNRSNDELTDLAHFIVTRIKRENYSDLSVQEEYALAVDRDHQTVAVAKISLG